MAQGQGRLDDVLPAPFDGGLVGPGGPGGPGGSPADPGQGAQPPDVEVFTVTGAGYDHFFATPDTSGDPLGRELLDLWRQSQDLISLEWVVSPVRHVGLTNPIEDFREYMDGNFEQLATGMVAVRSLADFWHQMGIDAHQLADALRVAGGGEAVTAAAGWCDDFGSACAEHEIAIKLWAGKIESETALLVDSVDTMISVATTIVESLPSLSFEGDNLIEKGLDLLGSAASSVARAVTRIGNVIKNFLRLFDAFRILAQAFMSLLAQPVDDLTFPEVTPVGSLPGFDDDTDRRRPR